MKLINELLHDSSGMARFNSVAEKSYDALNENVSLSPFVEFGKSLFARFDAAPSIIVHFQFIIEKISDKHRRPSAGKAQPIGIARG